jgi:hypothetical protein
MTYLDAECHVYISMLSVVMPSIIILGIVATWAHNSIVKIYYPLNASALPPKNNNMIIVRNFVNKNCDIVVTKTNSSFHIIILANVCLVMTEIIMLYFTSSDHRMSILECNSFGEIVNFDRAFVVKVCLSLSQICS